MRAKAREELELAEFHLREALELDPTDEVTKEELRSIRKPVVPPPQGDQDEPHKGFLGRLFGRPRRKSTPV
jgi:hypothetical protein